MDSEFDNALSPSKIAPRSRVTVVCAECKRLKLKCDRRNPCSSCLKRDTIARCVYSAAAVEKVDLHSLNNRLVTVENLLAQLTSGQLPVALLGPTSATGPPSTLSSSAASPPASLPYTSLSLSLDDVSSIWLDHLDVTSHVTLKSSSVAQLSTSTSNTLPSTSIYYPASLQDSSTPTRHDALHSGRPMVTLGMLNLLPPNSSQHGASATLHALLNAAEHSTHHTYPCINWTQFRARVDRMVARRTHRDRVGKRNDDDPSSRLERERDVPFYSAICAALALGALELSRRPSDSMQVDPPDSYLDADYWYRLSAQTLVEYERALTTNVNVDQKGVNAYGVDFVSACLLQVVYLIKGGLGPAVVETSSTFSGNSGDAAMASRQRRREKDREPAHSDRVGNLGGVAAVLFALTGKLVNVAREVGLSRDPEEILSSDLVKRALVQTPEPLDEQPDIVNFYDVEIRRRLWWDVLYYDLFVSDALGHEPLISDDFCTRIPCGELDKKALGPSSRRPPPLEDLDETGYSRGGFQYFEMKCQLSLLVRKIQRRMCASELSTTLLLHGAPESATAKNGYGYGIEQAASMEAEVIRWLQDLPSLWRLPKDTEQDNVDPIVVAQRVEIAVTAQRLIVKIYMPFLRKHASVSETVPAPYQATCGSVNAAHQILQACEIMLDMWKRRGCYSLNTVDSMVTPAMFDFYPFTRIVFDAAVICAHASIKQPMPMLARAAEDALDLAHRILGDPECPTSIGARGLGSGHDVPIDCALRLLDELKAQALSSRGVMGSTLKRKHSVVEKQEEEVEAKRTIIDESGLLSFSPGPSGIALTVTQQTLAKSATYPSVSSVRSEYSESGRSTSRASDGSANTKKSRGHPVIGIRIRNKEDSLLSKRRLSVEVGNTKAVPSASSGSTSDPSASDSFLGKSSPFAPPMPPTPVRAYTPTSLHLSDSDAERHRTRSSSLNQQLSPFALLQPPSITQHSNATPSPFPATHPSMGPLPPPFPSASHSFNRRGSAPEPQPPQNPPSARPPTTLFRKTDDATVDKRPDTVDGGSNPPQLPALLPMAPFQAPAPPMRTQGPTLIESYDARRFSAHDPSPVASHLAPPPKPDTQQVTPTMSYPSASPVMSTLANATSPVAVYPPSISPSAATYPSPTTAYTLSTSPTASTSTQSVGQPSSRYPSQSPVPQTTGSIETVPVPAYYESSGQWPAGQQTYAPPPPSVEYADGRYGSGTAENYGTSYEQRPSLSYGTGNTYDERSSVQYEAGAASGGDGYAQQSATGTHASYDGSIAYSSTQYAGTVGVKQVQEQCWREQPQQPYQWEQQPMQNNYYR
ncbi:hypothetical protein CYLTODRAFT_397046 [Cylindrobasidium torrendii FP15055 ss-10]|uniref:Zn(2)-C6 fungal-type domain-containing protein n=1 Tax=Cylindrobasidium torrendii FP15055 ss-10 TaxID=1314674 RepID=A0A0D7BBC2_9AGAR|nr:hypothetical protein CYLTODRAFT_397046 [Cylindrobasidium torrendii FP15055 ss-10]